MAPFTMVLSAKMFGKSLDDDGGLEIGLFLNILFWPIILAVVIVGAIIIGLTQVFALWVCFCLKLFKML
jgi:hypothetical protein